MNNETIINNLDKEKIVIGNTIMNLTYQGYVVNKAKYDKLFINNILTILFNNIKKLTLSQQEKIKLMYNNHITFRYG